MDRASTGGISWPLKSASGENPSITQGRPITFLFTDLPDRSPTGPLAAYLPGCFLTIKGKVTQAAETGVAIPRDVLPGLLIDSIDWGQSFFGSVLNTNNVKGKFLPVIEFTANGFKYGQRQQGDIATTAGDTNFSVTVWLPAASDRRGKLLTDTSNLALCFQPSQCKINFAGAGVLNAWSPGATFSDLTCRLTADLDLRQELVLGTPMEWVLHEIAAAGPSVKIEGFGRNTSMTGVEEKGGVAFLGELTGEANQDGIIHPELIQQISFQWRGLGELQDIDAWVNKFVGLLPNDRPQQGGNVVNGIGDVMNDFSGYPNQMDLADTSSATQDETGMRFFPFALGGYEVRLTDLQTADQDQTYYVTQSSPFSGTHQILAQYARVWQDSKRAVWEAMVRASGLPQYCFGNAGAASAVMQRRIPLAKHYTTPDQYTYLSWCLQPPA
jgi:hypothetical protein